MKSYCAALLLLCSTSAVAGEWFPITVKNDSAQIADLSTIKQKSSNVYQIELFDFVYKSTDPKHVSSVLDMYCAKGERRLVLTQLKAYSDEKTVVQTVPYDQPEDERTITAPIMGSSPTFDRFKAVLSYACDKSEKPQTVSLSYSAAQKAYNNMFEYDKTAPNSFERNLHGVWEATLPPPPFD